jgi:hypothetical protein
MDLGSWLGGIWRALRGQTASSSSPATDGGTSPPAPDGSEADGGLDDDPRPARNFRPIIVAVLAASLLLLAFYATLAPSDGLAVFGMLVLVAAAAIAVGSLLGFLFGIPRSLQDQRGATPEPGADADRPRSYMPNTNLEQISDWLTKILVGVGLIQLGRAPGTLGRLVDALADGLGGQPSDRLMVGAVLVFYPIFGFLTTYLLTRLLLQRAFSLADLAAVVTRKVTEVATETVRDEVARQQRRDADGFSLVAWQLKPPAGTVPPTQEQLDRAMRAASPSLRSQVFTLARDQRNANWRAPDRTVMMRTIPVFRALIAADASFHRNHGQLGYALKDSDPPDYDGARAELDTAIRLRDQAGIKGWLYYELNRAALDIKLDNERQAASLPPDDEARGRILADLRAVAADEQLYQQEVVNDAEIQDWLRRNAPAADLRAPSATPAP